MQTCALAALFRALVLAPLNTWSLLLTSDNHGRFRVVIGLCDLPALERLRCTCSQCPQMNPLCHRAARAVTGALAAFAFQTVLPAADAPRPEERFDAEVARKFAAVKGWRGFYEVHISGSPAKPHDSLIVYQGSQESTSYGTFELQRDKSDGSWWDPSRGMFQWSGDGQVRASHHVMVDEWYKDGTGSQIAEDSKATLPLRRVHITIALAKGMFVFHNGDDTTKMRGTRSGFQITSVWEGKGPVYTRHPVDPEALHGAALPILSRPINRVWTPIALFPQVAGGPGTIAVNNSWEGAANYLKLPGPVRGTEQLLLFPIYEDLECEVTIADYATWQPKGSIKDPAKPGNALIARAVLKSKDGKAADLPEVDRFRFELLDTSREPGICLNWPLGAKDDHYDLRFAEFESSSVSDKVAAMKKFFSDWGMTSSGDYDAASMPAGGVPGWSFPEVSEDGQKGELPEPPKDGGGRPFAEVAIESFDFGGKSELRVTCVLKDGREIVGLMKAEGGGQDLVRLPKRDGPDWVAEPWRKENDAMGLAANDDDEKVEGQTHNGDGFTLYEEYRGWIENGKHVSGDPRKKDLFVRNEIGADAKGGLALFERVSQIRVHAKLRASELIMLPIVMTEGEANAKGERIMNLNHREGPHRVDQHAVVMITTEGFRSSGGGTEGVISDNKESRAFRPGKVRVVHIEGRGVSDGIFSQQRSTARYKLSDRDASFAYDRGVAHELLHTVGADHHGEGEERKEFYFQGAGDPMNPTHRARFVEEMPPTDSALGGKVFGNAAVWNNFDRGPTITLLWEDTLQDVAQSLNDDFERELAAEREHPTSARDGAERAAKFPQYGKDAQFWSEFEIYNNTASGFTERGAKEGTGKVFTQFVTVGEMNQADSGNELCLMRYYFATAYPVPGSPKTYYLVRPGANRAGRELCKTPEGTGANASSHKPKSRFGDSAPNRGGCFKYICPNDAIPPRTL